MKKVFITGISGGMGKALAKKFLQEGCCVIGQYNKNKPDIPCELVQCDLADKENILNLCDYIQKKHPDIDVLINNAGIDWYGLFTDMTIEEEEKILFVNLLAPMEITKAVGKNMLSNKKGVVLNISSIWGRDGGSCEAVYSATKGGLNAFTKAIAKEWGLSNVRSNALCLGFIDTPINDRFSEEDKSAFCENVSLGRIGTPEEGAEVAFFLCSEKASYLTGQIISVDGGM